MKRKLNYPELCRLDTRIDATLKWPLMLIKVLKNRTIGEIVTQALTEHLGCQLEIILEEMNPDADLRKEIVNLLKNKFERL